PRNINYQENIIYIESLFGRNLLIRSVSWIVKLLQDEQATSKELKIVLELTCIMPNFWQASHNEGIVFSESSKKLALSYLKHLEIDLSTSHDASISDKERIRNLYHSLDNHLWKDIEGEHYQIQSIYDSLSLQFHHTYSFISEYHIDEIINLINKEKRVWQLLFWLANLPEKQKKTVLLQSTNQLAKFLLLLDLRYLLEQEKLQLSDIWVNAPSEWFQILNKHPVRYPWLQLGLGKFLASAKNAQIKAYVDSIEITASYEDIQDCLMYFFTHSTQKRIHYFCELAYKKWECWDFYDSFEIKRSGLDIAIVKYFQDITSDEDRMSFIQNEIEYILFFNKKWFASIVELNKFVYYHLSRMQPACMADAFKQDNSLSFDKARKHIYYPEQFLQDLRWKNWIYIDL
ncbi:hypothetical protein, partial [Testudinibacter sp. TR-2022]|uniref:hypothetical protein n=1 Tax=Testudinibacter sp. TR-2022 TaxID=2585029 RepID=UPI00159BEE4F